MLRRFVSSAPISLPGSRRLTKETKITLKLHGKSAFLWYSYLFTLADAIIIFFVQGRTLNSHEYLFWCGDFNYRIDMDKDEMKDLIKQGDLEAVLQFDQLKV